MYGFLIVYIYIYTHTHLHTPKNKISDIHIPSAFCEAPLAAASPERSGAMNGDQKVEYYGNRGIDWG